MGSYLRTQNRVVSRTRPLEGVFRVNDLINTLTTLVGRKRLL